MRTRITVVVVVVVVAVVLARAHADAQQVLLERVATVETPSTTVTKAVGYACLEPGAYAHAVSMHEAAWDEPDDAAVSFVSQSEDDPVVQRLVPWAWRRLDGVLHRQRDVRLDHGRWGRCNGLPTAVLGL